MEKGGKIMINELSQGVSLSTAIQDSGFVPGQSIIRPIIDNMTFIFNSISIKEIFEHLELMDYYDDFIFKAIMKEVAFGLADKVIIDFLHIKFDIHKYYLLEALSYDEFNIAEIADKKLPKVRVEFTGTALRFLRCTGSWNELYIMTKPFPNEDDHLTRVDVSYDLIDYRPYFLKQCVDFLNDEDNYTPSGRIGVMNVQGGMVFETKGGAIKTVYLGASTSDKRLRIYDKRHEQGKRLPESDFPECTSWIRIEWQCRNKYANRFHKVDISNSKEFYLTVFKTIYKEYAFANTVKQKQVPAQFWIDLWKWEEIHAIMQNAKNVQKDEVERTIDRIGNKALYDLLLVMALLHLTPDDLIDLLNKKLRELNHPNNYTENMRRLNFMKKYTAFSSHLLNFRHTHFDSEKFSLYPVNQVQRDQMTINFETYNALLYVGE